MKAAFLFACLFLSVTGTAQSSQVAYLRGLEAADQYQFDQAIRAFYDCYQADPTHLDCLARLAQCHQQMGNLNDARIYYQAWARADSLDARAWMALGDLSLSMGEPEDAKDLYQTAVSLDTTNAYFQKKLGSTCLDLGQFPAAIVALSASLDLNSRDLETISKLGEVYLQLDNLERTGTLINQGLALNPTYRPLLRLGVRLANRLEDRLLTTSYGQRLLATGDSALYFTTLTGYAWFQQDSLDQAIPLLEWVCLQDRASELAHFYYAMALEAAGQTDSALVQMNRAIDKGQSDYLHLFHEQSGRLYARQKNYKDAVAAYEAAGRIEDEAEYIFQIGRVYDEWYRDKSPAIRYYQKYLRSGHQQYAEYTRQRLETLNSDRHQKGNQ
ncbi:MAG: tetratricopeptide repeat protein [Saprospiraceae bacterium]